MSIVISLFGHAVARWEGGTRNPADVLAAPALPPSEFDAAPKALGPVLDCAIVSASTILPKTFDLALANRASPAAAYSDELYDIASFWGVNPAVALAFFVHESSCGTQGVAKYSRNWGNLRAGPAAHHYESNFAYYSSFAVSLDDWCRLLTGPLYVKAGLTTVSKVTPRYAPSADNNNPRQYAEAVNRQVALWASVR